MMDSTISLVTEFRKLRWNLLLTNMHGFFFFNDTFVIYGCLDVSLVDIECSVIPTHFSVIYKNICT